MFRTEGKKIDQESMDTLPQELLSTTLNYLDLGAVASFASSGRWDAAPTEVYLDARRTKVAPKLLRNAQILRIAFAGEPPVEALGSAPKGLRLLALGGPRSAKLDECLRELRFPKLEVLVADTTLKQDVTFLKTLPPTCASRLALSNADPQLLQALLPKNFFFIYMDYTLFYTDPDTWPAAAPLAPTQPLLHMVLRLGGMTENLSMFNESRLYSHAWAHLSSLFFADFVTSAKPQHHQHSPDYLRWFSDRYLPVIDLLLDASPDDINKMDHLGKTPLDIAMQGGITAKLKHDVVYGRDLVISRLLNHGAKSSSP